MEILKEKLKLFCKSQKIPIVETKIERELETKEVKRDPDEIERQNRNYERAKTSFYFPGLGQYAFKKEGKSYLFIGSFLFTLWIGYDQYQYSHMLRDQSREMYAFVVLANNLQLPIGASVVGMYKGYSLQVDSNEFKSSSKFWYGLAGAIYLFNIYDAFYISSDTKLTFQFNPVLPKLNPILERNVFAFSFKKDFDL